MSNKLFKLSLLNKENQISKSYLFGNKEENNGYNPELIDLVIFNDDNLENIKYKITSVLEDKNINHYYFSLKQNIY